MTIPAIRSQLALLADAQRAAIQMRFFKTGPGEYGEGDRFMGVRVPELRRLSRLYRDLDTDSVKKLLRSAIHEERHLALFILACSLKWGTLGSVVKSMTSISPIWRLSTIGIWWIVRLSI